MYSHFLFGVRYDASTVTDNISMSDIDNTNKPFPTSLTWIFLWIVMKKVKQSHHSPGQSLRVPESWGSQVSKQSAHEGGKVVSPTHRPLLFPGNNPATHFC